MSKGSSLFCGSSGNPKQLEQAYKRLASYQHIFTVIGAYQDKKIKEDIIEATLKVVEANQLPQSRKSLTSKYNKDEGITSKTEVVQNVKNDGMCDYCELMKAVSLCPNGFIAKKLVKELPDTEWIAGILYEEGNVVDKDLERSVAYYEQAYKKKNF